MDRLNRFRAKRSFVVFKTIFACVGQESHIGGDSSFCVGPEVTEEVVRQASSVSFDSTQSDESQPDVQDHQGVPVLCVFEASCLSKD